MCGGLVKAAVESNRSYPPKLRLDTTYKVQYPHHLGGFYVKGFGGDPAKSVSQAVFPAKLGPKATAPTFKVINQYLQSSW